MMDHQDAAVAASVLPVVKEQDGPCTAPPETESPPSLLAKASAEFIGCCFFHFIGSVCPTPFANAAALMTMVYYSAKISGAHLNPAVTTTFTLLGYTKPIELIVYWVAQVTGCVVGALCVAAVVPGCVPGRVPTPFALAHAGCFVPAPFLSLPRVLAWEFFTTLSFIVPVFSVVWYTQNKAGYGNTGPIMVGLSLLASALAAAPFTGGSLNPARTLGSAIVFDCARRSVTAVFIAGQFLASCASVLLIAPWYGVAQDAWYTRFVPSRIMRWLRFYQPSISLVSVKRGGSSRRQSMSV